MIDSNFIILCAMVIGYSFLMIFVILYFLRNFKFCNKMYSLIVTILVSPYIILFWLVSQLFGGNYTLYELFGGAYKNFLEDI